MTSILFESPLPILIVGVLAAATLAAGFYNTSRLWMLWAAGGVLVLTAGLWMLEQAVVTERELVEEVIYATARDLERNDVPAVIAHVSPQAAQMRRSLEQLLPTVEISSATVKSNLEITLRSDHRPPLAEATFNCSFTVNVKNNPDFSGTHPRFLIVRLRKEEGRWRFTDYEVHDPLHGSKRE